MIISLVKKSDIEGTLLEFSNDKHYSLGCVSNDVWNKGIDIHNINVVLRPIKEFAFNDVLRMYIKTGMV